MAFTQTPAAVDVWAEVAADTVREGATTTVSDSYQSILHIDMAVNTTTAHATGTRIIVQTSSSATADEFWTNYMDFVGPTGTANTEAVLLPDPLAVGAVMIEVADETGFTANGLLEVFLEDATPANSEIVLLAKSNTDTGAGTNDRFDLVDGTTRAHAITTSILSNLCKSYEIVLPLGTVRVRVLIDNTYQTTPSTVFTRTRIVEVTALS